MRVSNAPNQRGAGFGVTLAVALAVLILRLAARAQAPHHDPQGRYDLQVPAGWQVAPDQGADQIIVCKGAAQVIVGVIPQNKSDAMQAERQSRRLVSLRGSEFSPGRPLTN